MKGLSEGSIGEQPLKTVTKVTADTTRGREEPPKQKQSWVLEEKDTLSCITKGLKSFVCACFLSSFPGHEYWHKIPNYFKINPDVAKWVPDGAISGARSLPCTTGGS